jgi:hypothetical protein
MRIHLILRLAGVIAAILISVPTLFGTDFYSYIDENGVRVITNIPPINCGDPANQSDRKEVQVRNQAQPAASTGSDPEEFNLIIKKYATYYEVDPNLIHSIIATESGFDPNAVSSKGARGLMQLMPSTARQLGVEDSFDPEQNIQAGVRHFRSLMDTFNNDLSLSLAAYNAGENLVRRLGRVPGYKETVDYVRSVTRRYNELREQSQDPGNASNAPTFRFLDASGVLHVTNIPSGP